MCQCYRLKQCQDVDALNVSVFCRLSLCQCVAWINNYQCVASSHNVGVLLALTFTNVLLQAVTMSVCFKL